MRPPEDIHAEHTTFFVPRALPSRFVSGYCLTDEDSRDLGELVAQRDRLIALYQHQQSIREPFDSAELASLRIELAEIRSGRTVPTRGPVRTFGPLGRHSDGWYGDTMVFGVEASDAINRVKFRLRIPEGVPTGGEVTIEIDGSIAGRTPSVAGVTEVTIEHRIPRGACALVRIRNSVTANPKKLGIGKDERDLGIFFEEAEFA